jgi:SAM-dependent methyltransferase
MEGQRGRGNESYDWSKFDTDSYFGHYYNEAHPDDDALCRLATEALGRAAPAGQPLDVIDVGTGPNLLPLLTALPRAGRLTAWEYAPTNIAWLKAELEGDAPRWQWQHYWRLVRETAEDGDRLAENPLEALRGKVDVHQGSIFDLPTAGWDAATMFFCAESMTQRQDEFDRACRCFAGAVRPGGTLVGAFLNRSDGYVVAGRDFPVLEVTPDSVLSAFGDMIDDVKIEMIGIVEEQIRSGYAGMILLTATRSNS